MRRPPTAPAFPMLRQGASRWLAGPGFRELCGSPSAMCVSVPATACSTEPPLCPPCAAYAQRACPMVSGHMARYQRSVSPFVSRRCGDPACWCSLWAPPNESSARLGAPAEQWYALWTREYLLIRDDAGRLAAGLPGRNVLRIREIGQCPAAPTRDQRS